MLSQLSLSLPLPPLIHSHSLTHSLTQYSSEEEREREIYICGMVCMWGGGRREVTQISRIYQWKDMVIEMTRRKTHSQERTYFTLPLSLLIAVSHTALVTLLSCFVLTHRHPSSLSDCEWEQRDVERKKIKLMKKMQEKKKTQTHPNLGLLLMFTSPPLYKPSFPAPHNPLLTCSLPSTFFIFSIHRPPPSHSLSRSLSLTSNKDLHCAIFIFGRERERLRREKKGG